MLYLADDPPFTHMYIKKRSAIMEKAIISTDKGNITIEFFEMDAPPNTVANFKSLYRVWFYNGLTFHRVVPGFVIQGGCRTVPAPGGARLHHQVRNQSQQACPRGGAVDGSCRARYGRQPVFICHDDFPHLDGMHTVFGRVTDGMDVVDRIVQGDKMNEVRIVTG